MTNPWNDIDLNDYENHMKLDSVMQLQAMNEMMFDQFYHYPIESIMILGVAGGNGLEYIIPARISKVYGVDVNRAYLAECVKRYPLLNDIFIPKNEQKKYAVMSLSYKASKSLCAGTLWRRKRLRHHRRFKLCDQKN